ncbi:MAG: hypothetical protein H7Y11_00520, partial [Armatimonadetes bacterium]|nr:hypothetical protein [Anaerolineae bacterium]
MLDDQQAYEQLRGLVAQQERAAATLEAEVVDLERELNDFRARYYAAVGYAEKRLEAAQALLLDLQRVDAYTPTGGRLPPN